MTITAHAASSIERLLTEIAGHVIAPADAAYEQAATSFTTRTAAPRCATPTRRWTAYADLKRRNDS